MSCFITLILIYIKTENHVLLIYTKLLKKAAIKPYHNSLIATLFDLSLFIIKQQLILLMVAHRQLHFVSGRLKTLHELFLHRDGTDLLHS